MKKIITLLLNSLLLVSILSSCLLAGYTRTDGGVTFPVEEDDAFTSPEDDEEKESAAQPSAVATDSSSAEYLKQLTLRDDQIYYIGETASVFANTLDEKEMIDITITGAELTKSIGEYNFNDFNCIPKDAVFDGSSLTSNHSFLFVSLEVTNTGDKAKLLCLLNLFYCTFDSDMHYKGQREMSFFEKAKYEDHDYGKYLLEPGETLTTVVGYIMDDGTDLSHGCIPVLFNGVYPPPDDTKWLITTERG